MWGKPPFSLPDNYAIDVHNLAVAREWYKDKLGLSESHEKREDDSGRPFTDLQISKNGTIISLLELSPGTSAEHPHIVLFSKNLEKTQQWLMSRGVMVEPITNDSGGNRLFRFRDLEGNSIEVCAEP